MKLKEGQEIVINVPFTYTVGQESNFGEGELNSLDDMYQEVRADIDDQVNGSNVCLEATYKGKVVGNYPAWVK